MNNTREVANRLVDAHGRNAVGEAFLRALEARLQGDGATEAHWITVTVQVMRLQRVRSKVEA